MGDDDHELLPPPQVYVALMGWWYIPRFSF